MKHYPATIAQLTENIFKSNPYFMPVQKLCLFLDISIDMYICLKKYFR